MLRTFFARISPSSSRNRRMKMISTPCSSNSPPSLANSSRALVMYSPSNVLLTYW